MGHSPLFDRLARTVRIALACEREGLTTAEGLARAAEADARASTRRELLGAAGRLALAGGAVALAPGFVGRAWAGTPPDVGVVGAGLAGLVCTDELRKAGIKAALYEASDRAGGRQYSLSGLFPGQVCERGGELIDNLHKTMIAYAKEFGLTLEDMSKVPGEVFYYFDGQRVPEATVVDQYRAFVGTMGADLRKLSNSPTADAHTDADVALDRTTLLEYLEGKNATGQAAGPIVKKAIIEAYEAEYGLAANEQSSLNFLLFIHKDKRSKFTPFGVFSDERFHVVEGNDRIAGGIAARLSSQLQFGMKLVKVARTSAGKIELTFATANKKTVTKTHDAVVIAVPFSVLAASVTLDASLALPPEKLLAIRELGYGNNAKQMIGFSSRPWRDQGSNGASYSDLPNYQATWETNPTKSTESAAILTDYASADRGLKLRRTDADTDAFLADGDRVFPGLRAAATKVKGSYLVHLEAWPTNPLTKGSYTCYKPGQFTTIAGNEGKPVGNLHFAGEHTNSFYEWQGFMEGACLSGIQAASEILADVKAGKLGG